MAEIPNAMANQRRMLSYERQWVKMVPHPISGLDSQLLGKLRISHFFGLSEQEQLESKFEDQTQSKKRLFAVHTRHEGQSAELSGWVDGCRSAPKP